MENIGLGAGLAAIAFWGFVAVAVIAGVWKEIRKREAQHETVRRLLESGQEIDPEVLEKLAVGSGDAERRPDRDLRITAMWILPVSVGIAVLGYFLGMLEPDALFPLLGVAAMLACLGIGWLVAAKVAARWYADGPDRGL